MYKVEKKSNGLYIRFDGLMERSDFVMHLRECEWMKQDGYMTTRTMFDILGDSGQNPYKGTSLMWNAEEIENKIIIEDDLSNCFPYVFFIEHPHKLNHNGVTYQKKLEGIDDGGERIQYGENGAFREPSTGKGRYDLISPFGLRRIAMWYELGALKYAERNWEKGIPMSRCVDSAMRHLNKFLMGMTDEDHLAAAAWNIIAIMHYEETGRTDLDDLPHFIKNLPESAAKPLELVDEMHGWSIKSEEGQNESNLEVSS